MVLPGPGNMHLAKILRAPSNLEPGELTGNVSCSPLRKLVQLALNVK